MGKAQKWVTLTKQAVAVQVQRLSERASQVEDATVRPLRITK